MHVNWLLLLIPFAGGQIGESWRYGEYVDAARGYAPLPDYVPLQSASYRSPPPSYAAPPMGSPSYAAPPLVFSSQPPSQEMRANSRGLADAGRLGPATPPSEARVLDSLQTLPPQLRLPPPPPLPFFVDNKVIDRKFLTDEKVKYEREIEKHLQMMEKKHERDLDSVGNQYVSVKKDIDDQIQALLKYKEDQLLSEYNKGLQALKEQAQAQRKELEKRAAQMKESRNSQIDEKLLQGIRTLDSTNSRYAQTVREAARVHERTFDEAITLLTGYQHELQRNKEDYEFKVREMAGREEERLKRQVEARIGLFM